MLFQGIKHAELLAVGFASLHFLLAILILKYIKNIVRLSYNRKSEIIITEKNGAKFEVKLVDVKNLIELDSFRIQGNINPLKTKSKYTLQLLNKTKLCSGFIFLFRIMI